jgi:transcriptional regulator with XRE-family HTH domain
MLSAYILHPCHCAALVHLLSTIHHCDPFVSRLTFAYEFPFIFTQPILCNAVRTRGAGGEIGMARHNYKLRTHDIGLRLVALRNQTRLTQTELGQLIGVSRRSILKWEGGEGVPNGAHLQNMLEVFADQKAFTAGQERAEAEALWEAVSQAATKRLGRFNTAWFEQLLAQRGMENGGWPRSPIPYPPSSIIDWGEAIDVPTLYGRS